MQLPKFILDKVKEHKTPLSNNEAIPIDSDVSIEETLLQDRFDDICYHIKEIGEITSLNEDVLISQLSNYLSQTKKIENKYKSELEKICIDYVYEFFDVPEDYVDLECNIVDEVAPTHKIQIMPKNISNYDIESMEENNIIKKVIKKRRFINSLIQGSSYQATLSFVTNNNKMARKYIKQIETLDENLPHLYIRILAINDYLLFTKEENITNEATKQGSYVSVELGTNDEKTSIKSQAINFPFLLMETLRGFSELFASHGLPQDNTKMEYILTQSDYLTAEPWDLRFGVSLFDKLSFNGWNPKIYPFIFKSICELKVDDFNALMNEIILGTKVGKREIENICQESKQKYLLNKDKNTKKLIDIEPNELPLNDDYIASDDESNGVLKEYSSDIEDSVIDAKNALINSNWDEIFFEMNPDTMGVINMQIIIDNGERDVIIPNELVKFKVRPKKLGDVDTYEVYLIDIAKHLRGNGIAPKLYYSFILAYGSLYSGFNLRVSKTIDGYTNIEDMNIDKVWKKIEHLNDIGVEIVMTEDGNPIGEIAYKK